MGAVYILCDPREDDPIRRVRYVGVSVDPVVRLEQHCAAGSERLRRWVAQLRKARHEPELLIIEPCDWAGTGVCPVELKWISFYWALGAPLLNVDRVPRLPADAEAGKPPPPLADPCGNDFTADLGVAFGKRLKDAREAAQLTQQDLADKSGVNRVTIANWEAGEGGGARADQVKAVAAALKVHPGDLLFGVERKK